jgi:hypothetical protein
VVILVQPVMLDLAVGGSILECRVCYNKMKLQSFLKWKFMVLCLMITP